MININVITPVIRTVTLVLLTACSVAHAEDFCTPELIKALRTNYTFTDKSSMAEITQQIACSDDKRTTTLKYEGYSFSQDQVNSACSRNDRAFFQKNRRDLSMSFLPPATIDQLSALCDRGPNNLTLDMQGSQGDLITIVAKWTPSSVKDVKRVAVKSFAIYGPAHCPPNGSIKAGSYLTGGGVTMVCNRTGDGKVIAVVNTKNEVTRFASNTRLQKPKIDLELIGVDDLMSCSLNNVENILGLRFNEPRKTLNLNALLHPGANMLSCTVTDNPPAPGAPQCWGYSFQVLKNGVAIAAPSFSCCDRTAKCNKGGEVINIPIEYPE